MSHALLSPSSASRWLKCTPSARLEAERPDKAGDAADEGTLAHRLSEIMLEQILGLISKTIFKQKLKAVESNKHYSESMWEYCDQYRTFVMQQYAEAQAKSDDAVIYLEKQVNLTEWVPEGFGTRDVAIIAAGMVEIIDLKYGKGVKVDAIDNSQMMLYGLGTLNEYDVLFDIDTVRMTIYQPRIDNYSTYELSANDLRKWGEETVRIKAQQAWAGEGEFCAGSHCHFCKVRTSCKANADMQMELAKYEFAEPTTLTPEELVDIFNRADSFKSWINAIEKDMLSNAVLHGVKYPGLKLVQGRSNRIILEPDKVQKLLAKTFEADDYLTPRKLLGIGALEKNIGKKELVSIIGKFIDKPEGKPTLVDESDKRDEYHSTEAAAKIFDDDNDIIE